MKRCAHPRLRHQALGSLLVNNVRKLDELEDLLKVPRKSLKLSKLFSTEEHGWDARKFHDKCDNQGPTITILQTKDQRWYGGYARQSWRSGNNQAVNDSYAFLFRCNWNVDKTPVAEKFEPSGNGGELRLLTTAGPIFGYYNDFHTFSDSGSILPGSSSEVNGAYSFNAPALFIDTTMAKTSSNFKLEVLSVGTCTNVTPEPEVPWLPEVSWNSKASCF